MQATYCSSVHRCEDCQHLSCQNLDADETDLENTYVYDNLNSVERRCKQQGVVQSVENWFSIINMDNVQ